MLSTYVMQLAAFFSQKQLILGNIYLPILDISNEKLRPPLPQFKDGENGAFRFSRESITESGGRGGVISHFILSKISNEKLRPPLPPIQR